MQWSPGHFGSSKTIEEMRPPTSSGSLIRPSSALIEEKRQKTPEHTFDALKTSA